MATEDQPGWPGKRVLVTGGAGFIGSHVVDRLLGEGAAVTVFDDFSTGFREFLPPREGLKVVEDNLLRPAAASAAMRGIDFLFHLAANADVKNNLKAYAGGERGWAGDAPRVLLDTTRLRALGWTPRKTIEHGVVETLGFLGDSPFVSRRLG